MEITYIMKVMKAAGTTLDPAEVLEAGKVRSRQLGQAMKPVLGALSRSRSTCERAFGVIVYSRGRRRRKRDLLATAGNFVWAYLRGWQALSQEADLILTSEDKDHLQIFEAKNFSDVRVFAGKASPEDLKEKMKPSPGIYILSAHMDVDVLNELRLPALPEGIRDIPLVIQVQTPESFEGQKAAARKSSSPWGEPGSLTGVLDPRKPAPARDTLGWRKQFVSENPCFSSAQVAEESTSRAENRAALASRWIKEKKIFSVRFEGKQWFPRFQFQDGAPIPVVSEVIRIFPEQATGWDLAYFFSRPNANIEGRKPLELIRTDPDRLRSLAQAFAHPADVF